MKYVLENLPEDSVIEAESLDAVINIVKQITIFPLSSMNLIQGWDKLSEDEQYHLYKLNYSDLSWNMNVHFQIGDFNKNHKPTCQICWEVMKKLDQIK